MDGEIVLSADVKDAFSRDVLAFDIVKESQLFCDYNSYLNFSISKIPHQKVQVQVLGVSVSSTTYIRLMIMIYSTVSVL